MHTPVSLALAPPLLMSLGCSGGSPSIFRICGGSELALGTPELVLLPLGVIGNGNCSLMVVDGRVCSSTGRGVASLLKAVGGGKEGGAPGNYITHASYTRYWFHHHWLCLLESLLPPHPSPLTPHPSPLTPPHPHTA